MNTKEALYEESMKVYKEAMQDCQLPYGALAELNPIEYYAYTLQQRGSTYRSLGKPNPEIPSKMYGKAVVQYCRLKSIPVIASMNGAQIGGTNKFAAINSLKSQGMSNGCPDLFIPVPKNGYHGMFCKIKRSKGGVISADQLAWHQILDDNGYRIVVAYGSQQAIDYINSYLA